MKFAVIGAGSGGQCMAAHLTQLGHEAVLYDIDQQKLHALQKRGEILLENKLTGAYRIACITSDIQVAVTRADFVMVVTTTDAHGAVAEAMAPYMRPEQIVVLHPGHCGGAVCFAAALQKSGCQELPHIAECQTLIYGCRQIEIGHIFVTGIKKTVLLAAYPSKDTELILKKISPVYPQFRGAASVLETSMSISGCLMHVIPTLMNTNRIDAGEPFDFYMEGITPHIAGLIEDADQERVAVAEKLGVHVKNLREWLKDAYGLQPDTLYHMLQANEAYRGSAGPKDFNHRFVMEEVTGGFVPLSALGQICGIPTPVIDLFIQLAARICGKDFLWIGRTVENMGLTGKSMEEVIDLMTK